MHRDDIVEYSLLAGAHSEEHGKAVRKKIWFVFWLMLCVTIIEVGMGMKFSRIPEAKIFLIITFIAFTILKAGYIVMSFMHLGDEVKTFTYSVLIPFIMFILYLIFICVTEANYNYNMIQMFG